MFCSRSAGGLDDRVCVGAGVRFGVAMNVVITLGLYQLCTCGLLGAHSLSPVVRCGFHPSVRASGKYTSQLC